MKNKCLKKYTLILTIITMFLVAILTFQFSSAKIAFRQVYTLKLGKVEHFHFSAGQIHNFEIPYDGYYAFKLWGGDGGDSKNAWSTGQEIYELGGKGGEIAAISYFSKGTVIIIVVGTRGNTNKGGFNGGGDGGIDAAPIFNNYYGGGDGYIY